MRHHIVSSTSLILLLGLTLNIVTSAYAQEDNPQILADQISENVAQMRGLPFKKKITAQNQSLEDFSHYLDAELRRQLPEKRNKYFGKIVRELGLYRGPEIENMAEMVKAVMTSQAGAYYDPDTETFYVLTSKGNSTELGTIYSHELYHGLQDQYWDLNKFLLYQAAGALNDDQLMARQAVVEGKRPT